MCRFSECNIKNKDLATTLRDEIRNSQKPRKVKPTKRLFQEVHLPEKNTEDV